MLSFKGYSQTERKDAEEFLEENFFFMPLDREIARVTAKIRRTTKLKLPDATIAATAMVTMTPLVTRNISDFSRVHGLHVLTI